MDRPDFGLPEWDVGALGDDFLEMLDMSQSIEQYSFNLYSNEDWMEFVDTNLDLDIPFFVPSQLESQPNAPPYYEITPDFDHDLTPINETRSSIPKDSKKINFEDCLSEFTVPQVVENISKHRKRFSSERRREVSQIRKAGACVRCKIMKTPCKLELPCATCMKACSNLSVGKSLCTRQKLTDVRFAADLWDQTADMAWLKNEVPALCGPKKTLDISLAIFCDSSAFIFNNDIDSVIWAAGGHDGPWTVATPLQVEVQEFQPKPGSEHKHIFVVPVSKEWEAACSEPRLYAISEDSLPTLDRLEEWALDTARNHPRAFVGGIRGSFLTLGRRYCECKKTLPLQGLVKKAIRLTCLHGIWDSELPIPRANSQQSHQYASNAAQRQISVIVAKSIADIEFEILSLLHKYIFGSKGPGRTNMLPIWTCLWLLILTYRHTINYYARDDKGRERRQLAQHMYDMLVSIYSALFRPSSPLWLNWLREDVFDLFGRDRRVMVAMGTLKTEIGYYAANNGGYDFRLSRDALIRSLIFDQEKKLGQKLMERPSLQDPAARKGPMRFNLQCYLVEKSGIRPRRSSWGMEQNNRLSAVKEASMGTNGFGWPSPAYGNDESDQENYL